MKKTFDERFTDFADTISEGMGKWWITALSVIAVLVWLASGPIFNYSDTWQLMVNTPTTIIELWIGFLLAAAANRVEKRNRELQQTQMLLLKHVENLVDDEDKELKQIEQEVKQERQTQGIVKHLDQQDTELVKQTQMLLKLLERRYHP